MIVQLYGYNYIRKIYKSILHNQKEIDNLCRFYDYIYIVSYGYCIDINGFTRLDKKTAIIDLSQDIKTIYDKFNDTTRNEINKTFNNDKLTFVPMHSWPKHVYKTYYHFERSQGRHPLLLREFSKYIIFAAFYKDSLLAYVTCFEDNNIIRIANIGSIRTTQIDNETKKLISNSTRRLVYEMCKFGIEQKYDFLDLGIVNLTDESKKGIAFFKMGFNRSLIDTYLYRFSTIRFNLFNEKLEKRFNIHIH